MNSGQAIKTLMNVSGMSQKQIAQKLGVGQSAIAGRVSRGNLSVGALNEMLACISPGAKVCICCKNGTKLVLEDMPSKDSKRGKNKK